MKALVDWRRRLHRQRGDPAFITSTVEDILGRRDRFASGPPITPPRLRKPQPATPTLDYAEFRVRGAALIQQLPASLGPRK